MLILVGYSENVPTSLASFELRAVNIDQILNAKPRAVSLFTFDSDGRVSSEQRECEIIDCVLPTRDHVYLNLTFAEFCEKCHIVQ